MMTLAMMALLIGALLGLRFKVFILVPAVAISSVTILGVGVARSDSIWLTLLAAALTVTALQVGYLSGASSIFQLRRRAAVRILLGPSRRRKGLLSEFDVRLDFKRKRGARRIGVTS
jgi:hypothetical protein